MKNEGNAIAAVLLCALIAIGILFGISIGEDHKMAECARILATVQIKEIPADVEWTRKGERLTCTFTYEGSIYTPDEMDQIIDLFYEVAPCRIRTSPIRPH